MARGRRWRRARRRRLWARLGVLVLLLAAAWGAGFGWFVHRVLEPARAVPKAEGIVVLTGGSGRMQEGFRLLLEGRAPRLLVSGVGPETSLAEIAELAHVSEAALEGRVDLDRRAASTEGNAGAAAAWAAARHLRSLIVVTSFYHMPRTILEFRAALPRVRLVASPVRPRASFVAWSPALWRVVVAEYCKWLVAEAGLGGPVTWLHRRGP